MFGIFHDAGYKGMYGMGRDAIKKRKSIPANDNLMDRMGPTELAANNFRLTQTRDKLAREHVSDQGQAILVHCQTGKDVRAAITTIGGLMPEEIPPAEHIREVQKRLKNAKPILQLEAKDARGLASPLGDSLDDL